LHGAFRRQLRTSIQAEPPFAYTGKEIVTLTGHAVWAISAVQSSDYYELTYSVKALRPYVYSIPFAVKANVGVPLGIMIAPSERQDVFFTLRRVARRKKLFAK
jgi:hypothetical protein